MGINKWLFFSIFSFSSPSWISWNTMNFRWRYLCAIICIIFILVCNVYILKSIFSNTDTSLVGFNTFHSRKETRDVKPSNETKDLPHISFKSFKTYPHLVRGFKCDLWFDICLSNGIHQSLWHPLYPTLPQDQHTLKNIDTKEISKKHQHSLKRLYGFIEVNQPSRYTLSFQFDGSFEVIFMFAGFSIPNKWDHHFQEMFHFAQNNKKEFFDKDILSISTEHEVFLKQGYYALEILSLGNVKVSWNSKHSSPFMIDSTVIFHPKTSIENTFSYFTIKHSFKDRFPVNDISERKKLSFYNFPSLEKYTQNQSQSSQFCPDVNIPAPQVKLFKGIYMIDNILVYPKEFLDFTDAMPVQRLLLPLNKAQEIATKTVKLLSQVYQRYMFLIFLFHQSKLYFSILSGLGKSSHQS